MKTLFAVFSLFFAMMSFAQTEQEQSTEDPKISKHIYSIEFSGGVHGGKRQLRDVHDNSDWKSSPHMENSVGHFKSATLRTSLGAIKYADGTYLNPDVSKSSPYYNQQGLFYLKYTSPELVLKKFQVKGIDLKIASNIQMEQTVWNRKFLGSYDQEIDPSELPSGTVIYEKYRTVNPTILLAAPKIPLASNISIGKNNYSIDASASIGVTPIGMVNFRRKNEQVQMILKQDNVFSGVQASFAVAIRNGDKTFLRFFYEQSEQFTITDPSKNMKRSSLTLGCQAEHQITSRTAIGLSVFMNEILQKIDVPTVAEGSIVKTSGVAVNLRYNINKKKKSSEVNVW